MIIEKRNIQDRKVLMDCLGNRVFHVTIRAAFDSIQKDGGIQNNQSGNLPINTSSMGSYGRLQGYVCLFDLRNKSEEIISHTLDCYYFLGPTWFMRHGRKYIYWDLVYLFLKDNYFSELIPNSAAFEYWRQKEDYLQVIPDTEVWIKDSVPLTWIEKALVVKIRETAPDINTPFGLHYWALMRANDKR
jgi:hypothetical protein